MKCKNVGKLNVVQIVGMGDCFNTCSTNAYLNLQYQIFALLKKMFFIRIFFLFQYSSNMETQKSTYIAKKLYIKKYI